MSVPPGIIAFFQRWLVTTLAVLVASFIVEGIRYDGWESLLVASLLLGLLNAFVKPLIMFMSLPFLLVTLGLFTLVINAALLYCVGWLVKSFHVENFGAAFWGALVISLVSLAVQWLTGFSAGGTRLDVQSSRSRTRRDRDNDDGGGPVIDV
jgi:putative membrane protein